MMDWILGHHIITHHWIADLDLQPAAAAGPRAQGMSSAQAAPPQGAPKKKKLKPTYICQMATKWGR
jgi:hypothetical protein